MKRVRSHAEYFVFASSTDAGVNDEDPLLSISYLCGCAYNYLENPVKEAHVPVFLAGWQWPHIQARLAEWYTDEQ